MAGSGDRSMAKHSILFVCLGNICRSPLAEGLFRHVVDAAGQGDEFHVDSAGTGGWHIGDPPDRRAIAVAASHGVDIARLRGRKVSEADFARFDVIVAMDKANLATLEALAPAGARDRIHLFAMLAEGVMADVPDPYYGDERDFEAVYGQIYRGCSSIAARPWDELSSKSGKTSSTT